MEDVDGALLHIERVSRRGRVLEDEPALGLGHLVGQANAVVIVAVRQDFDLKGGVGARNGGKGGVQEEEMRKEENRGALVALNGGHTMRGSARRHVNDGLAAQSLSRPGHSATVVAVGGGDETEAGERRRRGEEGRGEGEQERRRGGEG